MAEAAAVELCTSDALIDRGRAVVFDVLLWGRPARAFVLRFDGHLVAYLNQCAHVAAEMDWQEGEFLDAGRRYIICSIHGATYEPRNGVCIAGPCTGARLRPLNVSERDGRVSWYPSPDICPLAFGDP
jgi:nitrite reductase/ring-hydroxylating ferredoxin subunit